MPQPRKYASAAEKQAAYRARQQEARRKALELKGLPPLPAIPTMPGEHRWKGLHQQARTALETMLDEMRSYYDERSEEWQESERGEAMLERIEALESVLEELNNIT